MASLVPTPGAFAEITTDIQTTAGINNNNTPGHKMLAKLGEGLARIQTQWALVVAGGDGAVTALAAMEQFIIVEKYPGGSRKNRQSKKRKNNKNHSNNKQ